MNAIFALAVAVCFGVGSYLLLKRDLLRVVAGVIVLSYAANIFVIGSGLARGRAPILPVGEAAISDPLTQSMALTAVVITFGGAALLLGLVWRVFDSHGTIDQLDLREDERQEKERLQEGNE